MIHKKANFGETKDIMVCEMGTGDVWMIGSEKGEDGENPRAIELGMYIPSTGETFSSLIDPGLSVFFKNQS